MPGAQFYQSGIKINGPYLYIFPLNSTGLEILQSHCNSDADDALLFVRVEPLRIFRGLMSTVWWLTMTKGICGGYFRYDFIVMLFVRTACFLQDQRLTAGGAGVCTDTSDEV